MAQRKKPRCSWEGCSFATWDRSYLAKHEAEPHRVCPDCGAHVMAAGMTNHRKGHSARS